MKDVLVKEINSSWSLEDESLAVRVKMAEVIM